MKKILLILFMFFVGFAAVSASTITQEEFDELTDILLDSNLKPTCYTIVNSDTTIKFRYNVDIILIGPNCKNLTIKHRHPWGKDEWIHIDVGTLIKTNSETIINDYDEDSNLQVTSYISDLSFKAYKKLLERQVKALLKSKYNRIDENEN